MSATTQIKSQGQNQPQTQTQTQRLQLGTLQTEQRNPNTTDIDRVSTLELVRRLNNEDHIPAESIKPYLKTISKAIDATAAKINKGGRLLYIGAGTSGRLGVLDASELPPTYSADKNKFIALIAGGDTALRNSVESAEDSSPLGRQVLHDIQLTNDDTVIGIAASGRTPYVLGGLAYANEIGATTIGIACVTPSEMEISGHVDYMISPVTGPEFVTGSTRMKAGTATKLVLNMISTGIMIRIGKTCGNLMVDVKATNLKLQERSRRIIREVAGDSLFTCDKDGNLDKQAHLVLRNEQGDQRLDQLLEICDGSVKLAIAVAKTGMDPESAKLELEVAGGVLNTVLQEHSRV